MTKVESNRQKYRHERAIDIALLVRAGLDDEAVAKGIGITVQALCKWKTKYEEVAYAFKVSKPAPPDGSGETFQDYVVKNLSPKMKEYWTFIEFWNDHPSGPARIEHLLKDRGVRVRQQLWMHAMIMTNFNASEACRMVNVSYQRVKGWGEKDTYFQELVKEVTVHKGNYFEDHLIALVKSGSEAAILFANKTFNKLRGYNEKIDVNVTGAIEHTHQHHHVVAIETLGLDLETRKMLLEKIREQKQLPAPPPTIPVEVVMVEAEEIDG